jgi:phenylpyruvate tautomerase PptA (4-oxalocrotonate tautomerase family)
MPTYQCQSPAGTLADSVRPEVVKEITRIHCENTGAPSSFVHVVFRTCPPELTTRTIRSTSEPRTSTALSAPVARLRRASKS